MHIVRTFKLRLRLRTTIRLGCSSFHFYYRREYLTCSRLSRNSCLASYRSFGEANVIEVRNFDRMVLYIGYNVDYNY